ncbi:MAG: hypothetical protein NVSMB9_29350 [Isosphaeraceae bacterium]
MVLSDCVRTRSSRRGVVVPIVGVLLVVLTGFLALAYDLGRVAVVHGQIQNAADAAALAGASALGTDNLLIFPATQGTDIATAVTRAQTFAQANAYDLNGTTSVILDPVSDVTVGILTTPTDLSQPLATLGMTPFNSVQVRSYVDALHGGSLNFLFAPVLGRRYTDVQATSTATVQLYKIDSLKALPNLRSPILPITMSFSDWMQMVNKQTGKDSFRYDPTTNMILPGTDGLQEQQLYPGSNVTSSNNGLIQFGTGSRSNAVLRDQVVNGPTYDQMIAQWPPSGSPPWNAQHRFSIGADPGWRATTFSDLGTVSASAAVRLIPINDGTSPGNGANGSYTIVAFAPIRLVFSQKGGNGSGYAQVQPAVINDPTVIASTTTLSGSGQGGVPVVRLSR